MGTAWTYLSSNITPEQKTGWALIQFQTILAAIIGIYATGCAAAPLQPARQAEDLSWVRSNTILYSIARPGIVATALNTGKSTVLVPGVPWGGETFLLSPDKTHLLYGKQVTGFWIFDLKTHVQLDLAKFLPANSLVQISPDWSLLAWTNPNSGRIGVIDLSKLRNVEFTLPSGLPAQDTVINSIDWSNDGNRILVDSVSSDTARRAIYVDPSDGDSRAEFGYAPSQASLTGAQFEASLKEQYWALDPHSGLAEPVSAYPAQYLHYSQNSHEIGTDWNFVCELCGLRAPLPDIVLTNGTRILTDEFGGIDLFQPDGRERLVQAPLQSSLKSPPMPRYPTRLWAVFDDNYILYAFNNQFWLYGVRENMKAPFFKSPLRSVFSERFQF